MRIVRISDNVAGAIRVDRGTDYGNPFVMRGEADRTRVCERYDLYAMWRLTMEPNWLDPLREAPALACWCAPRQCHAETLVRLLNQRRSR